MKRTAHAEPICNFQLLKETNFACQAHHTFAGPETPEQNSQQQVGSPHAKFAFAWQAGLAKVLQTAQEA